MKRQRNYFTNNIEKSGEDFLKDKDPFRIRADFKIIFRDLANGRIDLRNYAKYFEDDNFVYNLILEAYSLYYEYYMSSMGMMYYFNANNISDQSAMAVLNKHQQKCSAYKLIHDSLSTYYQNKTIEILLPLAGQLRSYKNVID